MLTPSDSPRPHLHRWTATTNLRPSETTGFREAIENDEKSKRDGVNKGSESVLQKSSRTCRRYSLSLSVWHRKMTCSWFRYRPWTRRSGGKGEIKWNKVKWNLLLHVQMHVAVALEEDLEFDKYVSELRQIALLSFDLNEIVLYHRKKWLTFLAWTGKRSYAPFLICYFAHMFVHRAPNLTDRTWLL